MGILLFELRKNENNTDVSLYQTYSLKLHENILKYYKLDLFKEIDISLNHAPLTTSEPPVKAFPTVSLFK